ncbi:hypothetical protein JXQ70_19230 [bacterium]|nr:hypothetical protein [bacterium]
MKTRIHVQKPPEMPMSEFLNRPELDQFDGVQLYLNETVTNSDLAWVQVKELLDSRHLETIVHLANPYSAESLRIGRDLAGDSGVFVLHYLEETAIEVLPWGVLGLENACFGVDRLYHDRWLDQACQPGRIPVFDIPRLFKNSLMNDAVRETERLLDSLRHYLLHLIDFTRPEMDRTDFIPMGQGLLSPVLESIIWPVRPDAVVLEFEHFDQSFRSLDLIRKVFC